MTDQTLNSFFSPAGIVLVGATSDAKKLGFSLTRNLIESDYPGGIHLVNPKGGQFRELTIHRSISDVPDPVDLAVLLIPAMAVPGSLRACAQRGIRAVIIESGGFSEIGEEGRQIEDECRKIAVEHGLRLLGPNCIGIIDTHLPLDTTFLTPAGAPRGSIAFVSQSGAMCAAAIDWSRETRLGWSRIVSLGNQLDVSESDVLDALGDDSNSSVVAMYLEGVKNGRRFVEVVQRVSAQKPVVALKVGRSASGQKAVASHTGMLAGEDVVYDAAFRRAGVIRAATSEELFDTARALASCPLPRGRRVAVLTNAGGPGIAATDAIEREGLTLATLSDASMAAIRDLLPASAACGNPVDVLASASASDFKKVLAILLADEGVDSVVVILPPPPHYPAEEAAVAIESVALASEKPVVVALMGGPGVREAARHLDASGIVYFRFPERAVRVLAALAERSDILEKLRSESRAEQPSIDLGGIFSGLVDCDGFLRPDVAADVAMACGINTAPLVLGDDPKSAARVAAGLTFPVALKVASPDIVHKADAGGIRLGIESADQILDESDTLIDEVHSSVPDAEIDGVLVQPMQPDGIEVVVGAVRDPQFGPVVMFGSGGVAVEQERDVTFELSPLARGDAMAMVARTQVAQRLAERPDGAVEDLDSIVDVICTVSELILQVPEITEFEINPLRVLERQEGVVAIDVRCKLGCP